MIKRLTSYLQLNVKILIKPENNFLIVMGEDVISSFYFSKKHKYVLYSNIIVMDSALIETNMILFK